MRVALTGGFYKAPSIIAGAQRCVNLYPEENQSDSPFPTTHYQTPGTRLLAEPPTPGQERCEYRASNGDLFRVVGTKIYYVNASWQHFEVGVVSGASTPVYMVDNGLVVVVVDGSNVGYVINLASTGFAYHQFDAIQAAGLFYGANRCDYVDTYFIFNRPGTQQWYISLSLVDYGMLTGGPVLTGSIIAAGSGYVDGTYSGVTLTGGTGSGATADITVAGTVVTTVTIVTAGSSYRAGDVLSAAASDLGGTGAGFLFSVDTVGSSAFDPLDIAAKVGRPDPIATLISMHREVWLLGVKSTEVWYNSGASDFTFQAITGVFIEHGCVAQFSIATADLSIFWLSQDQQGQAIVLEGNQLTARRISTHAIEHEFANYPTISDGVGFTYQQNGHTFYQLTFPAADKTWTYDLATRQWHERASTDDNGAEHRSRVLLSAFAYGLNVAGDWETGALYHYDPNTYTDDGTPIVRRRGFPHIVNDGKRILYRQFIADMEVGTATGTLRAQPEGRITFIGTGPITFTSAGGEPIYFTSGGAVPYPYGEPQVSLRWSDTAGASWSDPILLGIGSAGEYLRSMQAQRLGLARDRVFELFWDGDYKTALSGAWIDTRAAAT